MRALVIANRQPGPAGTGDAKVAYQVCHGLSSNGHTVQLEVLASARISLASAVRALLSLVSGKPLQIGLTHSERLRTKIAKIKIGRDVDVIIAIHARAAGHVASAQRSHTVAVIIDSYARSYRTYGNKISPILRPIIWAEAALMDRYEQDLARSCGRVVVLSQGDADYLKQRIVRPKAVTRVPYAVDIKFFGDTRRMPMARRPVFGFIGRLNYLPNQDAVHRLVEELWPVLRRRWPNACLRVVGAKPGARLRRLLMSRDVELAADVHDVREAMFDMTAMIIPMRMGGGVQTKILEAMAARVPVICSSFANEGILAPHNEVVLIADTAFECVEHATRIVNDPYFGTALSDAAFKWVLAEHAAHRFDQTINGICNDVMVD